MIYAKNARPSKKAQQSTKTLRNITYKLLQTNFCTLTNLNWILYGVMESNASFTLH